MHRWQKQIWEQETLEIKWHTLWNILSVLNKESFYGLRQLLDDTNNNNNIGIISFRRACKFLGHYHYSFGGKVDTVIKKNVKGLNRL